MKIVAIYLVTAAVATHSLSGAETPAPATKSATSIIITNKAEASARAPYLSAGLPEIVKMHKAGVDASVLLAFVQNSPTAYHPSAKEIIYLRDQGLSSEIISAMLRRGGELRERTAEAAREERSRATPAPAPAAPAPPQAATPAPVVVYANPSQPVYTTPSYVSYPAYSYAAPAYYNYSYYRPYYNYSYCRPYYPPSYYGSAYVGYRSGCYTGYPRYGLSVGFGGGRYYGYGGGYRYSGGGYCRR